MAHDADVLQLWTTSLESAGHSAVMAKSVDEALRILEQEAKIHLVVLDYISGEDLAAEIRKRYPKLPFLLIADGEIPESVRGMAAGYLQKRKDPQALISAVSSALGYAADRSSKRPSRRRVILCVEDELLQLQARQGLFESAGYVVLSAQSGQTALDLFRWQSVDAVVMDYWLAGRNGTAVAEEMKKLRPGVPIVMLSSFSSLPGEGAVVDSWLRKAVIQPEELLTEVRRLIELRRPNQPTSAPE